MFVQEVAPGGPAEKAGLKEGDIIVAINGKPVKEGNELVNTMVATPIGNTLNVTVLRDKTRKNFNVVVGDLTQVFPERYGTSRSGGRSPGSRRSHQLRHANRKPQRAAALEHGA